MRAETGDLLFQTGPDRIEGGRGAGRAEPRSAVPAGKATGRRLRGAARLHGESV